MVDAVMRRNMHMADSILWGKKSFDAAGEKSGCDVDVGCRMRQ